MPLTTRVAENLYQLELIPYTENDRTTGYVITGEINVLVETGASPSLHNILNGLNEIGLKPEQIDVIIVTHIHLDHSGGVGLFLSHCPSAKVFTHEKGVKHLIEPDKLIRGAREVYQNKFEQMFDPILAVPAERIKAVQDGETLRVSDDRDLIFYEAPGHALHHIVIYDSATNGIFVGDAAGAYYQQSNRGSRHPICVPSAAPTQFDPSATMNTINKMMSLGPDKLYFTHFGVGLEATKLLTEIKNQLSFFSQECLSHYQEYRDLDRLAKFIFDHLSDAFNRLRIDENSVDRRHLKFDSMLNARGIVAYTERIERK